MASHTNRHKIGTTVIRLVAISVMNRQSGIFSRIAANTATPLVPALDIVPYGFPISRKRRSFLCISRFYGLFTPFPPNLVYFPRYWGGYLGGVGIYPFLDHFTEFPRSLYRFPALELWRLADFRLSPTAILPNLSAISA